MEGESKYDNTLYKNEGGISFHLNMEEISRFLKIDNLEMENIRLIGRVNGHLMNCSYCRDIFENYKELNELEYFT